MDIHAIESNFDKGLKITGAQADKLMGVYTSAISALESLGCPAYRLVVQDIENKRNALARRAPSKPSTQASTAHDILKSYPKGKLVPKDILVQATNLVDKGAPTKDHKALLAAVIEAWERWLKVEPNSKPIVGLIKKLKEVPCTETKKSASQKRIESMSAEELRKALSSYLTQRSAKLKRLQTDKLHK